MYYLLTLAVSLLGWFDRSGQETAAKSKPEVIKQDTYSAFFHS